MEKFRQFFFFMHIDFRWIILCLFFSRETTLYRNSQSLFDYRSSEKRQEKNISYLHFFYK